MNRMEKLSRRKALLGLAAAGAGMAVAGTAKASSPVDPNLQEQKAKLQNVLEHVEIADAKFNRLATGWADPPDVDRSQFNALLIDINTECQNVMDVANELLLRRGA